MAKSKSNILTVTKLDAKGSFALVNEAIDRALAGARNLVQTAAKFEPILAAAAQLGLEHALEHGDVMPCHRLVTELPPGKMMEQYRTELVAWFRANSPIYWDAQGNPHQAKEGEKNYKPYNPEGAAAEAFYQRPQAIKARAAAAQAHKRSMEPLTFADLQKRVMGLSRWLKSATEADKNGEVRGIVEKDKSKMEAAIALVEATFEAFASGKLKDKKPSAVKAAGKKTAKATDDLKSETKKAA